MYIQVHWSVAVVPYEISGSSSVFVMSLMDQKFQATQKELFHTRRSLFPSLTTRALGTGLAFDMKRRRRDSTVIRCDALPICAASEYTVISYIQAVADSIHKGVLNEDGSRKNNRPATVPKM